MTHVFTAKAPALAAACLILSAQGVMAQDLTYPLVDTMQDACFNLTGDKITCPNQGEPLYGQDAQHPHLAASYTDNGDETVTDNNSALVWQKTP
jgi:hypothetical protein